MTGKVVEVLRNRIVTAGVNPVYIGEIPLQQKDCIALKVIDGYTDTRYFSATDLAEPLIEILIRAESYEKGQTWYNSVKDALDRYSEPEFGILCCWLTGSPGYLGRDVNNFGEWHMLFHVTVKE